MNKLLVAVCVLACGANALYHFHLNLPDPCDLIVNGTYITSPESSIQGSSRVHGTFEISESRVYVKESLLYTNYALLRPDKAEPGMIGALYTVGVEECEASQVDPENYESIDKFIDLYFTDREPNMEFYGIRCTALYNSTDPDVVYMVNEETGTLYGAMSSEMDLLLNITAAKNNRRELFKFDKSKQPRCDVAAYLPPPPAAYDAACKDVALPNFLRIAKHLRKH